jgi:hypothetical protein
VTSPDALDNAYAPPTVLAEDPVPSGHRVLLVLAFALCGFFFGCLCLSALILRVGSLRPDGLLPPTAYNFVFSVHSIFTLPFLNALQLMFLAVACPMKGGEKWRRGLFIAALCVVGLQAVAGVTYLVLELPVRVMFATSWATSSAVVACLVFAVPSAARVGGGSLVVMVAAAAAAVGAVVWLQSQTDLCFLLCMFAWLSVHSPSPRRPIQQRADVGWWSAVPLTLAALLTLPLPSDSWFPLSLLLWFCVSVWLGWSVWRSLSDHGSYTVRWTARAGLAVIGMG